MSSAVLERKIAALLELFALTGAAEQSISSYSKGMKQRVLIIAALLHDPSECHRKRRSHVAALMARMGNVKW